MKEDGNVRGDFTDVNPSRPKPGSGCARQEKEGVGRGETRGGGRRSCEHDLDCRHAFPSGRDCLGRGALMPSDLALETLPLFWTVSVHRR